MNYFMYFVILTLMVLPTQANWGIQGQAQVQGNMWGSGYWGGNQQCGYEVRESEEVSAKQEELKERRDELKDKQKELREAKSKSSSARTRINGQKKLFQMVGFEGEHLSFIDNHITGQLNCTTYEQINCSGDPAGYDRAVAGVTQELEAEDLLSIVSSEVVSSRAPAATQGREVSTGQNCTSLKTENKCGARRDCFWRRIPQGNGLGACERLPAGDSGAGVRPAAPVTRPTSPPQPQVRPSISVVTASSNDAANEVDSSNSSAPSYPAQTRPTPATVTPSPVSAAVVKPPTPAVATPPAAPTVVTDPSRLPATPAASTCQGSPTKPFPPQTWKGFCGPQPGEIKPALCDYSTGRAKNFNADKCKEYLDKWQKAQKELAEATLAEQRLKLEVDELSAIIKITNEELRAIRKEYQRELREQMSEGDCVDCIMQAGQIYSPRKASGLEIGANVAMGLASVYLGNRSQRYISDNNAKLGFATQPYPSVLNGYPYFMNAIYGAVGGGIAGGAGCFNAGGGAGAGGGGMWGYPPGMGQGGMYPSGMMMPGQGPWGANGPWGNAMCVTWPCPVGGSMGGGPWLGTPGFGGGMPGFGMGGNMGMPGFGGGMPGFGMGGNMGMPGFGGGLGGGFQLGGLPGMGGMPGMMGYPDMGMMGGLGMGGMAGMGGLGMGGMGDLGMQSQMMQMQMQQMQQAMQMQQQRMQAQMAYQQQVSNLTQELNTVMMRLRQAQMGMYMGVGGLSGGTTTPGTWSPTPTTPPSSTTPIGPPTFR